MTTRVMAGWCFFSEMKSNMVLLCIFIKRSCLSCRFIKELQLLEEVNYIIYCKNAVKNERPLQVSPNFADSMSGLAWFPIIL
jgi:hypothetical protein